MNLLAFTKTINKTRVNMKLYHSNRTGKKCTVCVGVKDGATLGKSQRPTSGIEFDHRAMCALMIQFN